MGSARVAQKGCIIEKEGRERFQEGRELLNVLKARGLKGGMADREILRVEERSRKGTQGRGESRTKCLPVDYRRESKRD